MGAEMHFDYSAVGDAVNVAARIESACKDLGFDILVSETTAKSADHYALLEAGALPLRGKSTRTQVYAVVGDEAVAASTEFAELHGIHGQLIAALRSRTPASRESLAAAKLKAPSVCIGLTDFYRRISRRSDHFAGEPPARPAESAE